MPRPGSAPRRCLPSRGWRRPVTRTWREQLARRRRWRRSRDRCPESLCVQKTPGWRAALRQAAALAQPVGQRDALLHHLAQRRVGGRRPRLPRAPPSPARPRAAGHSAARRRRRRAAAATPGARRRERDRSERAWTSLRRDGKVEDASTVIIDPPRLRRRERGVAPAPGRGGGSRSRRSPAPRRAGAPAAARRMASSRARCSGSRTGQATSTRRLRLRVRQSAEPM